VIIVIVLTVTLSATTTFMTVRQSAKRGLMQTNVDPSNPMAQSQKFMQYIVPFFSLTGLYWQYGLVLYWVTTNLWTLGQQYFMFRNWDPQPVGAEGALGGATTGGPVKTAQKSQTSSRTGSARPSSSGAAKTAAGGTRAGTAGTASGRPATSGSAPARAKGSTTSASARTGTASRPATTTSRSATTASRPATDQNGSEKRGLLRLGRAKQEPEPQDDVPTARVVRQQPVRQAKSKRSGKR